MRLVVSLGPVRATQNPTVTVSSGSRAPLAGAQASAVSIEPPATTASSQHAPMTPSSSTYATRPRFSTPSRSCRVALTLPPHPPLAVNV
jgi:hypothetical protein